jgi:hypothetical protein
MRDEKEGERGKGEGGTTVIMKELDKNVHSKADVHK